MQNLRLFGLPAAEAEFVDRATSAPRDGIWNRHGQNRPATCLSRHLRLLLGCSTNSASRHYERNSGSVATNADTQLHAPTEHAARIASTELHAPTEHAAHIASTEHIVVSTLVAAKRTAVAAEFRVVGFATAEFTAGIEEGGRSEG